MISATTTRPFTPAEIRLLRWSVVLLFVGRAWQGFFWDLPLRTFFWDEQLLQSAVCWWTEDTWQNYVTNQSINIDAFINSLGVGLGCFWSFCAVLSIFMRRTNFWMARCIQFGAFSLFLLALLYFKDKFYAWGQFFEYSTQVLGPCFLVYMVSGASNTPNFRHILRLTITTTFICHGLYALAYYPVPGTWIQWTMDILGLDNDASANNFLYLMGCLDLLAAFGIFFSATRSFSLFYCVVWGFATAMARVVANFYWDAALMSLHQHAYETIYRLIHASLPLLLWWLYKENRPK